MNELIAQLGQYGAIGIMLGVFIWLFVRAMRKGEERELAIGQQAEQREKALVIQMNEAREECREDSTKLVARIQSLEDRQHQDTVTIAKTCADALKMNAEAYKRLTETPPHQLPIVRMTKQ